MISSVKSSRPSASANKFSLPRTNIHINSHSKSDHASQIVFVADYFSFALLQFANRPGISLSISHTGDLSKTNAATIVLIVRAVVYSSLLTALSILMHPTSSYLAGFLHRKVPNIKDADKTDYSWGGLV